MNFFSNRGLSWNNNKGFTLIELLVVIAIIGVLSSIVLASLNDARKKGGDVAVKENLYNARSQIELIYHDNLDYTVGGSQSTGVCNDTKVTDMLKAAALAGGGVASPASIANSKGYKCNQNSTAWAVSAPLKSGSHWCIDSTGAMLVRATYVSTVLCSS